MSKSSIIARKEFADAITSKRFWIVMFLFFLLYIAFGSMFYLSGMLSPSTATAIRPILQVFMNTISSLSLMAPVMGIAFGYDAISRERESGTLRLLLSRPIYREDVINGKMISAIALIGMTISASALLAVSASILLLGLSPGLDDIVRLFLLIILSMVFTFAYYSISLLLSTLSSKSGNSLIISFGIWALFTFILPIAAFVIGFAMLGMPPAVSIEPGQPLPDSVTAYYTKLAQINSMVQMVSVNHHYSTLANSLLGSISPSQTAGAGLDIFNLISRYGIDVVVLIFYPVIFTVASYIRFTRSEEK